MSSWYDRARYHIAGIHAAMPYGSPFEDRVRALREGYPFGERAHHPYKAWLRAQKEYLARYQPVSVDTKRFPLSPLERLMAKSHKGAGK